MVIYATIVVLCTAIILLQDGNKDERKEMRLFMFNAAVCIAGFVSVLHAATA